MRVNFCIRVQSVVCVCVRTGGGGRCGVFSSPPPQPSCFTWSGFSGRSRNGGATEGIFLICWPVVRNISQSNRVLSFISSGLFVVLLCCLGSSFFFLKNFRNGYIIRPFRANDNKTHTHTHTGITVCNSATAGVGAEGFWGKNNGAAAVCGARAA